jgi:hypothetical protein
MANIRMHSMSRSHVDPIIDSVSMRSTCAANKQYHPRKNDRGAYQKTMQHRYFPMFASALDPSARPGEAASGARLASFGPDPAFRVTD